MKTIKVEIDVMVDDYIEYFDVKDTIDDVLDGEFSFYDVKLIDIEK